MTETIQNPKPGSWKMTLWRAFFWVASISVALVSFRFVMLGMYAAFPAMVHHLDAGRISFYLHVVAGPIALMIAPFQFTRSFRAARPSLHRLFGRIYAVAVLVGGVSGLHLAATTNAGPVAVSGFGLLSILWLWTTTQAVLHARAGRFLEHRRWMIRSAAFTFAGVTLRIWLGAGIASGMPVEVFYPYLSWICWIPNIIIAEMILRKGALPQAA
ncbi:MAG: DUF2306 domain-containing protein [Rhizobiaceae bacterium]|nr:DUF2306 domain-containing protein [Rhizobiaceae bacterium]